MNELELKARLSGDIVNVVDNLKVEIPGYDPKDHYLKRAHVAGLYLESGTMSNLIAEKLSSGLKTAKNTGWLTRAYITSTITAIRRWAKVAHFAPGDEKTLTVDGIVRRAARIQDTLKIDPDHADIMPADLKQVEEHLDAFGSTVLKPAYGNYYTLEALSRAISSHYGRAVTVTRSLDTFEPLDMPDHHELVDLGVFKLRVPIMPALIVSVVK